MAIGSSNTATLVLKVVSDTRDAMKGLDETSGKFDKFKSVAAGALGFLTAGALTAAIGSSVSAASDLNETLNKTSVVLGDQAGAIVEWSKTSAESMGMSQRAALDAAGTFGGLGKAAGLTGSDLADFSTDTTQLAADLASFGNTTPDEAITALGAAMRGEMEPIRKYNVVLDDMTLRQEAMKMGLIETTSQALTPQQKVLAAHAAIMEKTTDAQGDYARTSGSLANEQKRLRAQFEDTQAQLGNALLPIFEKVFGFLADKVVPFISDLSKNDWFAPVVAGAIGLVGVLWAINAAMAANPVVLIIGAIIIGITLLVASIMWLWNNVDWFRTFVQAAWEAIKIYFEIGRAVIEAVFNAIKTAIGWMVDAFQWLVDKARPQIQLLVEGFQFWWSVIQVVFEAIKNAFQSLYSFIATIVGAIVSVGRGVWDWLWQGVEGVIGWIREQFNNLVGFVGGLGAKIASAASGMWHGITEAFRGAINWIIRGWNGLEFTIPGFDVFGVHTDGFTLGLPDIPMLARGGIVTRPTLIGAGERGPEAIIPLSSGMFGNQIVVNIQSSGLGPDSPQVARDVVTAIRTYVGQNGPIRGITSV